MSDKTEKTVDNQSEKGRIRYGMENREDIIRKLESIRYIHPDEIPNIDLYMDQVTTFLDEHLESSKRYSDDKLLTKTMINNYAKSELMPPPEKKKYTRDHMYELVLIYYLKNILSISDTQSILNPLVKEFFNNKEGINFHDIYEEIFRIENTQSTMITKEILKMYNSSFESFANVEEGEGKDLLQAFSFIAMLCFDVHMKKQMIGKVIDEYFSES